jgi:hypothetical protein
MPHDAARFFEVETEALVSSLNRANFVDSYKAEAEFETVRCK